MRERENERTRERKKKDWERRQGRSEELVETLREDLKGEYTE